jgi:hypothetical protein
MKCPSCGNDNRDNKFCTKCGIKLLEKKERNKQEVKHKNQLKQRLIIGSITLFSGILILFLIDYANNRQENNKVSVQQEFNNNKIKKQESFNSPTPDNSQLQPSPSPSKTQRLLDDNEIIGNLIYSIAPRETESYYQFQIDWMFYNKSLKFNKEQNLWTGSKYGFSLLDYRNQPSGLSADQTIYILDQLPKSITTEINLGSGWINLDSSIKCDDLGYECQMRIDSLAEYFIEKYNKKKVIELRINISNEDSFNFRKFYYKNGDVLRFEIIPSTCQNMYNEVINPKDERFFNEGFFRDKIYFYRDFLKDC